MGTTGLDAGLKHNKRHLAAATTHTTSCLAPRPPPIPTPRARLLAHSATHCALASATRERRQLDVVCVLANGGALGGGAAQSPELVRARSAINASARRAASNRANCRLSARSPAAAMERNVCEVQRDGRFFGAKLDVSCWHSCAIPFLLAHRAVVSCR